MITKKEYELLKEYREQGYKMIARDKNEELYVYQEAPTKYFMMWKYGGGTMHIQEKCFTFIQWEDEKPTKIDELIRDYDSHQVITGVTNVNKTELVKEIEGIFDSIDIFNYRIGESCENYDNWGIDSKRVRDIFSAIDKHIPDNDKEVIPQFVVDWIEEIKDANCAHKLEILFDTASMPTEVYDWLKQDSKNWNILARAWLNGYRVEKEQLYLVELPNHQRLTKSGDDIKFYDEQDWQGWFEKDFETKLTKAEIESVSPVLMQFAVEVE